MSTCKRIILALLSPVLRRQAVFTCVFVRFWLITCLSSPAFAAEPADSDCDGFSDVYERSVGTDHLSASSAPTLADDPDLIHAWWPLTGSTVEKLGTGLDAALRNGAKLVNGGMLCNGNTAYACVRTCPDLDVGSSFSVSLWAKPAQDSCAVQKLIGRFSQNSNQRSWSVLYGGNDRVWIFISDNGTANTGHCISAVTSRRVRRDGKWQNIGISYSKTSGLLCVIDGKLQPLNYASYSPLYSIHNAGVDLTFGAYDIKKIGRNREHTANSFTGVMAQIFFSKAALTEVELKELFLLGRGGDLIGYWNRDVDGDGLPDRWERDMFSDISQGSDDDTDGDGLSNLLEFAAGTDPLDPNDPEGETEPSDDKDKDGYPDDIEIYLGSSPHKLTVSGNVEMRLTTVFKEQK